MFENLLKKLFEGKNLSFDEAENAMEEIMSGRVSPVSLSAWLTALKIKGETADEIGGCAAAMNRHACKIKPEDSEAVDIVGTGGDGAKTFNISTAAAFTAAGADITVAKHGNRAVSSKSGAADVLSELGINIELSPEQMENTLNSVGIAFLFAPLLHPAMKHAMPVRRELKTRTIFNILGPLCNPADTKRMVIGVYAPELCRIVAEAALKIGKKHVLIVHGTDGLDEISTTAPTEICELRNGVIDEYKFDPEEIGINRAGPAEIAGGTPAENGELIRNILNGTEKGPPRDIVIVNAAAAVYVAGKAGSLREAANLATESIDSGAAYEKLDQLSVFTNAL